MWHCVGHGSPYLLHLFTDNTSQGQTHNTGNWAVSVKALSKTSFFYLNQMYNFYQQSHKNHQAKQSCLTKLT